MRQIPDARALVKPVWCTAFPIRVTGDERLPFLIVLRHEPASLRGGSRGDHFLVVRMGVQNGIHHRVDICFHGRLEYGLPNEFG